MTDKKKKTLSWSIIALGLLLIITFLVCRFLCEYSSVSFPLPSFNWCNVGISAGWLLLSFGSVVEPITKKMIESGGAVYKYVLPLLMISTLGILNKEFENLTPALIIALIVEAIVFLISCVLLYKKGKKINSLRKVDDEPDEFDKN